MVVIGIVPRPPRHSRGVRRVLRCHRTAAAEQRTPVGGEGWGRRCRRPHPALTAVNAVGARRARRDGQAQTSSACLSARVISSAAEGASGSSGGGGGGGGGARA